MAVRTKLLAAGSAGAGPTTIYTAPAGFVTIIKSILVKNAGGAAGPISITVHVGASDVSVFSLWATATGTNGDSVVSLPYLVLNTGNSIKITYPAAAGGWYTVSGAELVL